MNTCKKCGILKVWSDFPNAKNTVSGYSNVCKNCKKINRKSRAGCKTTSEYNKVYRDLNKDYLDSRYFSRNYRARQLERYKIDKESILSKMKIYRETQSYKVKKACREANRRFLKLKATPKWLTKSHKKEIEYLYQLARDATIMTGEIYHVDHIIPLKNKSVCGLHVPWNLQVLPSDLNLSKSNQFQGI